MYVSCSFSFSLLFNFFEVVTNNSQEIRLVIQIFSLKLLVECGDYILNFIYLLLKLHLFFFTHKANLFSSLWFISKRSLISTFNISANSTNCNTDGCILFERQRDMVTSDRFIFVAKSLLVKYLSAIKTRNRFLHVVFAMSFMILSMRQSYHFYFILWSFYDNHLS